MSLPVPQGEYGLNMIAILDVISTNSSVLQTVDVTLAQLAQFSILNLAHTCECVWVVMALITALVLCASTFSVSA